MAPTRRAAPEVTVHVKVFAGEDVTGVVLAGGEGRRMGGADKGLQLLDGVPLARRALERLRPQVADLLVSANRNLALYERFGAPVVPDALPGFPGPLAGLLAAMEKARTGFVASVPCDTPDFPGDLVARLRASVAAGAPAAFVRAGGRSHPVFCLAPRAFAPSLRAHLEGGGRRVQEWLRGVGAVEVDFGPDPAPFANLNTVEDLERRGAPEA